ncbi:MAG: SH3 domain-containing C40 family peptidase [Bacteroidota bacterium]
MKRFFIRVLILPLTLVICTACHVRTNRSMAEINVLLDSLQSVYAPDTRIAYWKPELASVSGGIILDGEVGDIRAYHAIIQHISGICPKLTNKLRLLPEDEPGVQVNGLVNNSVAHMRSGPSHRAELVSEALLGTPVRILKEEHGWYLVQTPNLYLGWVIAAAVEPMDQLRLDSLKISDKIVFSRQYGFAYTEPDENSLPVSDLVAGSILPVRSSNPGFDEVAYPDGTRAWVKREEVMDIKDLSNQPFSMENLVRTALKFNGIPYLWGGSSSKAIDCSGFTSIVYYLNGIILMRDANQQSVCGRVVSTHYSTADLLPGDLLFFGHRSTETQKERITHVAIYLGDSEFIHASENLGKVGISSMDPSRDNYMEGYDDLFIRAVRPTGGEADGFQSIHDNPFYKEIIKPIQ